MQRLTILLQVRPVVHEEVRLEADDDMRRLIQGIKARGRRAQDGFWQQAGV